MLFFFYLIIQIYLFRDILVLLSQKTQEVGSLRAAKPKIEAQEKGQKILGRTREIK